MKKMTKLIFAMAVGTALVMACSKEQAANQDSVSNPASQEELTPQEGNLVFAASAAALEDSRTTVEDGTGNERIVKWAVGDAISVWWASDGNANATANQAGTSSSFSVAAEVSDNYYAGYPASAATAYNEGVLTMTIPSAQDGTFASANMMAATTTDDARSFAFHNVTGLLKFTVEGNYSSVVFRGAKGEPVVGNLPVSFTDSGVSLGTPTDAVSTIVVSLNGPGTYYISVLPGNFSEGFSATFYDADNKPSPSVSYNKTALLTEGVIVNLGTLDERIQNNLFVTPSGAGTKSGRSWDNAMGTAEFKAFIEQPVDGEGTQITEEDHYKAACIDGVTFHFAEGDYYLAGAAGKMVKVEFTGYSKMVQATFLGGYPTGLTGKVTTGRDASTNVTNFTGNGEAGILTLGNQTDFSFDGIVFRDMSGSENGFYALMAAAGSTGNLNLSCAHCQFLDNIQTNKGITGAGACVGKGTAVFTYCTFSGNSARNGSALDVTSNSNVTVSNCSFSDNGAWNTSGALQNEGGTLTVDDCVFTNNQSAKDSTMFGAGGAFHTNGSNVPQTTFNRCIFSGNRSKRGGAISVQKAKVIFNNCVFSDNVAYKGEGSGKYGLGDKVGGGAIVTVDSSADVTLNDCSFTENTAPYACGGAIYLDKVSAMKINAGTSFSDNSCYISGGAIFANANMTISGTSSSPVTFENNKTTQYYSQEGNGGAVYIREKTTTSMTYATFSGNVAGQPKSDGSEYNFSNGGAISMEGVTKFTATSCDFSGNLGRNGACLNLALGGNSDCQFNNCYFHDNHNEYFVSGSAKGNFSGGVARIGYGTAYFNQCQFKRNSSYNRSGVFHINNKMGAIVCNDCTFEENYSNATGGYASGAIGLEHGRAEINNCDFNGNYSNGYAGVIGVQNNSFIKLNGCIFRNNHASTRGMIQFNAGCLAYLNRVVFYNNWTTGGGCWGVAIHSGGSNVCMNNVLAYNNKCTASSPGNNITFNTDGGWLVTNTTVMDNCSTALFRANSSTYKTVFCNNILVNRAAASAVFHSSIGVYTDYGHNVLSYPSNPSSPTLASTDLIGKNDSSLGGSYVEQFTVAPYYACYQWNGSLSDFTPATATEVENAIKAYNQSFTAESSSCNKDISNVGQDFYNWLTGLSPDALSVDIRNVSRTGTMWPGSYQAN